MLIVTEDFSSVWHYHLSNQENPYRGLCGVWTTRTNIPLDRWGKTPPNYHILESWCKRCQQLRNKP